MPSYLRINWGKKMNTISEQMYRISLGDSIFKNNQTFLLI